jgi:hypothetical protein
MVRDARENFTILLNREITVDMRLITTVDSERRVDGETMMTGMFIGNYL